MANELSVRYTVGEEEIALDEKTVRNFLVTGKPELVTQQEILFYMKLCKLQGLNPFLKECYLIKYPADKEGRTQPAQMIVGKDAFTKRADEMPECKGWTAGVCVMTKDGQYIEREGSCVLPSETLVGGWCSVEKEGWEHPFKHTVSLKEYHTGKSTWNKMPATMIRKVALVQALRDAFPAAFQGMYDSAEISPEEPLSEVNVTPKKQEQKKSSTKVQRPAKDDVIDIQPEPTITPEQVATIKAFIKDKVTQGIVVDVIKGYGFHNLAAITKSKFSDICVSIGDALAWEEEQASSIESLTMEDIVIEEEEVHE